MSVTIEICQYSELPGTCFLRVLPLGRGRSSPPLRPGILRQVGGGYEFRDVHVRRRVAAATRPVAGDHESLAGPQLNKV